MGDRAREGATYELLSVHGRLVAQLLLPACSVLIGVSGCGGRVRDERHGDESTPPSTRDASVTVIGSNDAGAPASCVDAAAPSNGVSPVPPGLVFPGMTRDGQVIAAYWGGTSEQVLSIDPATGCATRVASLGDLVEWTQQAVYDDRNHVLFAIGSNAQSDSALYSLSLETKELRKASLDGANMYNVSYTLGGATEDGRVVAAYWAGTEEAVELLDPTSGTRTFVGVLGDLQQWQGHLYYDDVRGTAYAIGLGQSGGTRVYSLSLDGGPATAVDLVNPDRVQVLYVVGGVTRSGQLVVAYGDSPVNIALVDPGTGSMTAGGTLGGDRFANIVYGAATGTALMYGVGSSSSQFRYFVLDIGN